MSQINFSRNKVSVLCVIGRMVSGASVRATDIPTNITHGTLVISEDSELTSDVPCNVVGAPCMQLAAPGITLRLNGFAIARPADPLNSTTGCTSTNVCAREDGI